MCEIFFREMFRHVFDNEETTGTSNKAVEFLLSCFQPCCFGANNDALNRFDFGAKMQTAERKAMNGKQRRLRNFQTFLTRKLL